MSAAFKVAPHVPIAERGYHSEYRTFDSKERPLTYLIYAFAALFEIAGCFAFWAWLKMGKSAWWLAPGMVSLAMFAWLLTLVPSEAAGRTFAAYGGIYIAASILWLWLAENRVPDRWDIGGAAVCLAGTAIILFAPRS